MEIALIILVLGAVVAFFLLRKKGAGQPPDALAPREMAPPREVGPSPSGASSHGGAPSQGGAAAGEPQASSPPQSSRAEQEEAAAREDSRQDETENDLEAAQPAGSDQRARGSLGAAAGSLASGAESGQRDAGPVLDAPTKSDAPPSVPGGSSPSTTAPNAAESVDQERPDDLVSLAPEGSPASPEEGSPPPPPVRSPGPREPAKSASFGSLRRGLARSRDQAGFFGRLKALLGGKKRIDPGLADEIEEILLTSDVGVKTTDKILERLRDGMARGDLADEAKVFKALRDEAHKTLAVAGTAGPIAITQRPTVVLFVGVNGAGKTTTIGKLAQKLTAEGKKVMLSAGDTFRAAAVEQLKAWGERTGCEVVTGKDGADPSSVLFDAIAAARAAGADVLLADTAGRLHTKTNLMQEMTKIQKVASKALEGAPHETLLVIDSTNGQNALVQAREFKEALPLTGLVLTKLDGTAKGGVVLGICDDLKVPIRYVGVGERAEDLHAFDPAGFVEALLGAESEVIAA